MNASFLEQYVAPLLVNHMLVSLADTITPLIAADALYLFVINAIIGIMEGMLLKRRFGGGPRAVWWMIAANYLSAWVGWFALIWLVNPHINSLLGARPIERINVVALALVSVAFAITIVVEFGFVHLATRNKRRSRGRTLLATLCVNAASYAVICLWFLWTSFSLPSNARVRPLQDMGSLPAGTLYWVDPRGHVVARRLDQAETGRVVAQVTQNESAKPYQLCVETAGNAQRVQLSAKYSFMRGNTATIPDNLWGGETVLADAGAASAFPADYWNQRLLRKSVLDLRALQNRQMRVAFDRYRNYLDTDAPDGPRSHLYIGLGSIEWYIQEPTVLPDDKIVFEWSGQIVLFDPHTTKLAFVALGTCPAFIPSAK